MVRSFGWMILALAACAETRPAQQPEAKPDAAKPDAAKPDPKAAAKQEPSGARLEAGNAKQEPVSQRPVEDDADLQFLRDLTETRSFRLGRPGSVQVTPDGSTVLFLRGLPRKPELRLFAMDVKTAQVRELVTPEQVLNGAQEQISAEEKARRERMRVTTRGFTSYDLSHDGTQVLVTLSGHAYVVPLGGGKPKEVAGPSKTKQPIFDPRLSPDGKKVSFVRGGELWIAPIAGKERQITTGATATKTHAQAEFVAQEEQARFTGYWWSPDSKWLVYEEADLSGVEKLYFADPGHPETPVEATAYPRPGQKNARIAFAVVPADGGRKPVFIHFDSNRYEYVPRVAWQDGAPLTLLLLTRDQKDLSLVSVQPATGAVTELLSEHDDAWLNVEHRDYRWLKDGSGFLWATERNGGWQLELHPIGGAVRAVTAPDWGFEGLRAIAPDLKSVVVGRSAEAVDVQLWSVPLDGAPPRALTQGPDLHFGTWARESGAHVLTTVPMSGTGGIQVIREDGSVAAELPSIAEKAPFDVKLEVQKLGQFWTAIIRPHDFDAKRKYPVIEMVYGGPTAQTVHRDPAGYLTDQFVADHGYIVVHADNRGTPGRDRAWERTMQDKFAFIPLEDQVAALQLMAAKEPAMDLTRVGVMGHSFGGYMAALSVERRGDFYKAAVAGAPVVDFMNYDTAYTERYLGVPPPAGKSDVYPANGLLAYAKDLHRPLLIIHGTADDNVHFSESLLLADALFRAGKSFDLLPQVGQTHQFHEPALQTRYWQRVFAFFKANL